MKSCTQHLDMAGVMHIHNCLSIYLDMTSFWDLLYMLYTIDRAPCQGLFTLTLRGPCPRPLGVMASSTRFKPSSMLPMMPCNNQDGNNGSEF